MNNEKFIFKIKRDSIPEPEDFSIRKFSCFDFFASVNSFIEHNFAGAIKIDFPESYRGFLHISPRGFAYFISLLLSEIYGKSLVTVDVSASDTEVILNISYKEKLKREKQITDVAERSGFSVTHGDNTIILRTPVKLTQEAFVYAGDVLELINYFYEVFLT